MSDSSRLYGLQPTRLFRPWDFPGKSTGVGCHCLLCSNCVGISNFYVQSAGTQGLRLHKIPNLQTSGAFKKTGKWMTFVKYQIISLRRLRLCDSNQPNRKHKKYKSQEYSVASNSEMKPFWLLKKKEEAGEIRSFRCNLFHIF